MKPLVRVIPIVLFLLLALLPAATTARAQCSCENIQYDEQGWATSADVLRKGQKIATILRDKSWYVWHLACEAGEYHETYDSAQKAFWEACWRCP